MVGHAVLLTFVVSARGCPASRPIGRYAPAAECLDLDLADDMPVLVPPAAPPTVRGSAGDDLPIDAARAQGSRVTALAPLTGDTRKPPSRARRHRAAGWSITVRVLATRRQARSPAACNAPADAHPSSTDAALRGARAGAAAPMPGDAPAGEARILDRAG